ncbi:MAG: hypothetical protein FJZ66_07350 [Bacteroidetes bacterium]|nr:hypothetical protein [Bacteroidota bacterium]
MKRILLLACISCSLLTRAQYQLDCKITVGDQEANYRFAIAEKASKYTFNMEGIEMIMLNFLDNGSYGLFPEENMAIKMKQETLDTLEVCNCTFVKTGKKIILLGYPCDEYIQKCGSFKGNSESKMWFAGDLKFNPFLISPIRKYVSSSASRPSGFPLLNEGTLSDGTKVKFEVTSIIKIEVKPSDFIIPEGFTIIEY